MRPVARATVSLVSASGAAIGRLTISLLPNRVSDSLPSPLLGADEGRTDFDSDAPIQLLEGEEYRFEVHAATEHPRLTFEPRELITLDTEAGHAGRLRPGLHTGQLFFSVIADGATIAGADLEVRSRKLSYRQEYRWMLRDIADAASELVMERFAATAQRFVPDGANAVTTYQRFEFVRSLLNDEAFQAAMRRVVRSPYVSWAATVVERPIRSGLPASPRAVRALSRPGSRVVVPGLAIDSVPQRVLSHRTDARVDNAPNQFIKHALTTWRNWAASVLAELQAAPFSGPTTRGIRDAKALVDRLDEILGEELFREVSPMLRLPIDNQVLQKREGYRDIYRAYLQADVAGQLSWSSQEDAYRAGQRNVATLYEFWVFLQLGRIVADVCDEGFSLAPLIRVSLDGLSLELRHGHEVALTGLISRGGRRIRVELWFNRTFGRDRGAWARPMRPDCSLLLAPADGEAARFDPVWLHFDAKYRIHALADLFGSQDDDDDQEEMRGRLQSTAKRDDLLKMHSYRDAIKRSAGAYVVYPGTDRKEYRAYQELLPGLGAFALVPTAEGIARGLDTVRSFIENAVAHIAEQLTQHERARYWTARAYNMRRPPQSGMLALQDLKRPPADTLVLLGYVKSADQLRWIHTNRLYNLRAGTRTGAVALKSRQLAAEILFIYGRGLEPGIEAWQIAGRPLLVSAEAMVERGYPRPRGAHYFCLPLGDQLDISGLAMTSDKVRSVFSLLFPTLRDGHPAVVSLDRLWQAGAIDELRIP